MKLFHYWSHQQSYHQTLSTLFVLFLDSNFQYCCRLFLYHFSIQWNPSDHWNVLDQTLNVFLWDTDNSILVDPWHTKRYYQYLVDGFLDWVLDLLFLIQNLQLLVFCKEAWGQSELCSCLSSAVTSSKLIIIFFCIFGCLINSSWHSLPGPVKRFYSMIIINIECNLAGLVSEYIVCLTSEPLLRFIYLIIVLFYYYLGTLGNPVILFPVGSHTSLCYLVSCQHSLPP